MCLEGHLLRVYQGDITASRFQTTKSMSKKYGLVKCLLDKDLSGHAGTLVGLAVHSVGAGGGQLDGVLLAGGVEKVRAGDGISVNSGLLSHGHMNELPCSKGIRWSIGYPANQLSSNNIA